MKFNATLQPNFHLVKIDNGFSATTYSPPHQQAQVRDPIPVKVLSSHLDTMHLNENCGFIEEYKVWLAGWLQLISTSHFIDWAGSWYGRVVL